MRFVLLQLLALEMRIMQTNELRGLLSGIMLAEGHPALKKELPTALGAVQAKLPAMFLDCLYEQVRRVTQLQADIGAIDRRLAQQMRQMPACNTLAEIPGVGLMTATPSSPARARLRFLRRARVRRLDRTGAAADWHRRPGAATRYQQARRRLLANGVDARGSSHR